MLATSPYLNRPLRSEAQARADADKSADILPWRWERVRWRLLPLSNALRTFHEAVAIAEAETPHPQRQMARQVLRGLRDHSPLYRDRRRGRRDTGAALWRKLQQKPRPGGCITCLRKHLPLR